MEIVQCNMKSLDFDVALAGDFHMGAVNCHYGLIENLIADMAKGTYLLNMGDNIEAIAPHDKRYAHASTDFRRKLLTSQEQAGAFVDLFRPVRKKILAIGDGNHEAKLFNICDFGQVIAKDLDCPYGGYNYVARFTFKGKLLFKVFISHGAGRLMSQAKDPIQRRANQKSALRRKLENTGISDCIVMAYGHTHQLLVVPPTIDMETNLGTTTREVKQRRRNPTIQNAAYISPERRWYLNTGSTLRLYSKPGTRAFGYAEMMMLQPADLGWPVMKVRGGRVEEVIKKMN